jgi:ParB family transcriptional regulator, chromosome partitioning protein
MAKISLGDMQKGLAGKGLGRDALFGGSAKESMDKKGKVEAEKIAEEPALAEMIETAKITANPFQPRKVFDATALEALSESLKLHGLIQPITVRRLNQHEYQLISGERRWRAAQLVGLTPVPAYIRTADDTQMLELAIIENIQREDLNPIEEALSYRALMDKCGLKQEEVAERVNKGRSTITNLLGLLTLPPDIQEALKSKIISLGHGKILTGIKDLALQLVVFKQITEHELSVRDTEKFVAQYADKKKTTDPNLMPVKMTAHQVAQDTLSSFFGSKVDLKRDSTGKGFITIKFNSDKDLNRILDVVEERK